MGRTACTEPQCLYKGALYLFHLYSDTTLSMRMNQSRNSKGCHCVIRVYVRLNVRSITCVFDAGCQTCRLYADLSLEWLEISRLERALTGVFEVSSLSRFTRAVRRFFWGGGGVRAYDSVHIYGYTKVQHEPQGESSGHISTPEHLCDFLC